MMMVMGDGDGDGDGDDDHEQCSSLLHVLIQANLIKKLRVSGGKVGNFTMGGRERKIEREGQEKKVGIFEC